MAQNIFGAVIPLDGQRADTYTIRYCSSYDALGGLWAFKMSRKTTSLELQFEDQETEVHDGALRTSQGRGIDDSTDLKGLLNIIR